MKVIIMRGIPGSGKSTYVKNNYPKARVCSADHFFMKDGGYHFDPKLLNAAHGDCLKDFVHYLLMAQDPLVGNAYSTIVVDNTSCSPTEIAPYAALALAYEAELLVVTLSVPPEIGAARNVHGVPLATCKKAAERLQRGSNGMPPYWPQVTIAETTP